MLKMLSKRKWDYFILSVSPSKAIDNVYNYVKEIAIISVQSNYLYLEK